MDEELFGSDLKLQIEMRPEYLGLGVDLQQTKKGDLGVVSGRQNLGQAIMHRLLTRQGELADLGYPMYGSRLHELIGEPNNDRTRELLRLYAKECLRQEPRIKDVLAVSVETVNDNPHAVILDITVMPVRSSVPMNLAFPFYLEVA